MPGPRTLVTLLAAWLWATPAAPAQVSADFTVDVTSGTNPVTVQFTDTSTGGPIQWTWEFGDGSLSTEQNPTHVFDGPGTFDVRLSVAASLLDSDALMMPALITVAPAPQSTSFGVSATTGTNPLTVDFTDTSTGAISGWAWDFGDGASSSEQHPSHTYSVTGGTTSYSVSLTTFVGSQEQTQVQSDLVTVDPAPLDAQFATGVPSGVNPHPVPFQNLSNGAYDAVLWDFGDGTTSTEIQPLHTYSVSGATTSYDVALTVWIGQQSDTLVRPDYITVQPAPITLDFAPDVTQGAGELSVTFGNLSSAPPETSWTWDFGDGAGATDVAPQHVFRTGTAARYDVTLTATVGEQVESLTRPGLISLAPGALGPRHVAASGLGVPTHVTAGDVDGDGDPDVLVSEIAATAWYANPGDGSSFSGPWPIHATASALTEHRDSRLADLDGDGDLDALVALAKPVSFETLYWHRNTDGAGSFDAGTAIGPLTSYGIWSTDAGDVDGDGDLDVFGARHHGGSQAVWWQPNSDGLGTFGDRVHASGAERPRAINARDLDADGDLDVVFASEEQLVWAENLDGLGGSWTDHALGSPGIQDLADLAVADLDGDGDLDLLTGTNVIGYARAWWYRRDGAGYDAPVLLDGGATPGWTRAVAALDLDGDGVRDPVYARQYQTHQTSDVRWHRSDPAPGGPERLAHPAGWHIVDLAVADMDGDGDDDLITVDRVLFELAWLEAQVVDDGWTVEGAALRGSAGDPWLQGFGRLAAGETVALSLSDSLPGAVTTLVLGASALSAPFKGGTLVPFPDVLIPLPVDTNGYAVVLGTWPASVPAGLPVYLQHWIVDGAGPVGLSSSAALLGVTQP